MIAAMNAWLSPASDWAPGAESIVGTAGVSLCPHCDRPVRLSRMEDDAVQVVRDDGTRVAVEGTSARVVQQHFTERGAPQAQWTLDRWYTEHFLPLKQRQKRKKSTIGDYRRYVKRWSDWENHCTICTVVGQITPVTLEEFRTYIEEQKVPSGEVKKTVKGITRLLRQAQRDWVITQVAQLPSENRCTEGLKFRFYLPEVDAMFRAAKSLAPEIWPQRYSDGRTCSNPELWWQAFFVGGWNYGFRVEEWWSYKGDLSPITWTGVHFGPSLEIEGRDYRNEHGWLHWTPDKTDHPLTLPMNATVAKYMLLLWDSLTSRQQRDAVTGQGRRVWDFPLVSGTAKPKKTTKPTDGFYAAYWAIVEAAGMQPKRDATGKRLTHRPSHFRKTAHTEHRDRIGNAADWITGHRSGKSIGERNYYVAIDKVTESILAHPQPPSA